MKGKQKRKRQHEIAFFFSSVDLWLGRWNFPSDALDSGAFRYLEMTARKVNPG